LVLLLFYKLVFAVTVVNRRCRSHWDASKWRSSWSSGVLCALYRL